MILIIQNGYVTPNISKYINLDHIIIKSYDTNVSEIDIEQYKMIIILGGYQSVINITYYPYLQNVIKLIDKCFKLNIPLLGICLGCQLIAYYFGCEIISSGKMNIGYGCNILGYDNIFRCHIDYIVPNKNINVLEYHNDMPYFFNCGEKIYGIQCHPDIDPECVSFYTSNQNIIKHAMDNNKIIDRNNNAILSEIFKKLIF